MLPTDVCLPKKRSTVALAWRLLDVPCPGRRAIRETSDALSDSRHAPVTIGGDKADSNRFEATPIVQQVIERDCHDNARSLRTA
jgi:hypothetical protein